MTKTNTNVVEFLGLDDPRTNQLVSELVELDARIKKLFPERGEFANRFEYATLLKTFRLKARATSSLAAILIRLRFELMISDYE